ncbi:GNAT family N-acetyltransferase [Cesiribacter sp. SM1]|uniref:GNAT family N-acetyltransferase n=1 Tax=Cesiribacter sp. SM1 TaxID=2861196 RepID=UPI001CD52747|nr:GNAT family N-acetyltransferase [Cesiribacter sp. SM1]
MKSNEPKPTQPKLHHKGEALHQHFKLPGALTELNSLFANLAATKTLKISMDTVEVVRVTQIDIDQLQNIGRQTFAETFSSGNSEENMKEYLDNSFSTEKLKTELSDKNSEFYFALLGDRVVGYLKVNLGQSQTEMQDENALEIERIYVLKEYHGKKVGQLLYEKALEIAEQKGVDFVWLGVWEENPRAIQFYKKNGFVEFDKHIFKLGEDEQTDIMMKLQM